MSVFHQPTPAHCTSLSTQHLQPSSFFSRWFDGLELSSRSQCAYDSYKRSLKTILFSLCYCVQHIRGFLKQNALYKSMFYLVTYSVTVLAGGDVSCSWWLAWQYCLETVAETWMQLVILWCRRGDFHFWSSVTGYDVICWVLCWLFGVFLYVISVYW